MNLKVNNSPSTFEWIVWTIIVVGSILILLFSIIFYYLKYRKINKKIISIENIPIYGMFLAIFIIQAYFTRIFPHTNELIPFSMDNITVIAIGFILGPVEAILYGSIADIIRTVINGWGFQIVSFFIFPLTGLIAGTFGQIYHQKKEKEQFLKRNFNTEILLLIFIFASFIWLISFVEDARLVVSFSALGVSLLAFLFLSLWIYYYRKNNKSDNLSLIFLISLTIILARIITGFIIRPFAQHFYYEYDWMAEINLRVADSSYLIPIQIFAQFYFIKAAFYSTSILQ